MAAAAAAAADAATPAVGGKRRAGDDGDPADPPAKRPTTGGKEPRSDRGGKGLHNHLWRLIEMEGDQQEVKLHHAWPRREALINGIIACTIWLLESDITNKGNWSGYTEEKQATPEDHVMSEGLRQLREALPKDTLAWYKDECLKSDIIALFAKFREHVVGVQAHTLIRWFDAMRDSDGIDIRCFWRFDLQCQPEAATAAAIADAVKVRYEVEHTRVHGDDDGDA